MNPPLGEVINHIISQTSPITFAKHEASESMKLPYSVPTCRTQISYSVPEHAATQPNKEPNDRPPSIPQDVNLMLSHPSSILELYLHPHRDDIVRLFISEHLKPKRLFASNFSRSFHRQEPSVSHSTYTNDDQTLLSNVNEKSSSNSRLAGDSEERSRR